MKSPEARRSYDRCCSKCEARHGFIRRADQRKRCTGGRLPLPVSNESKNRATRHNRCARHNTQRDSALTIGGTRLHRCSGHAACGCSKKGRNGGPLGSSRCVGVGDGRTMPACRGRAPQRQPRRVGLCHSAGSCRRFCQPIKKTPAVTAGVFLSPCQRWITGRTAAPHGRSRCRT